MNRETMMVFMMRMGGLKSVLVGLPLHGQISVLANLLVLLIFVLSLIGKACRASACASGLFFFLGKDQRGHQSSPVADGEDDSPRKAVGSLSYKATLCCCIYELLCQMAVAALECSDAQRQRWSALSRGVVMSQALQVVVWFIMSVVTWGLKRQGQTKLPFILRAWWTVSLALTLCAISLDIVKKHQTVYMLMNTACLPALAFLCFVAARGRTGIETIVTRSDLQEPLLDSSTYVEESYGCDHVTPYSGAGIISLATLSWLNPILAIGAKRPLELKDVPLLAPRDRAESSYNVLKDNWEKLKVQNPNEQPSLTRAIFMSFWREALKNGIFAGMNTVVSYVGPFLISYFVDYLSGKKLFHNEGYVLASVFFSAKLVEIVTTRQWYLGVDILGMHVRAALTALVYEKGMRLSSSARQSHTSGEIINYMAVDVQRIGDYSWYLHDIWMLPMQIILALAILFKNVGVAAFATLIATIVSILINTPLAKMQEEYQDNLMAAKDDRMKATSECLRNMRIMKLQAWEERYRLKLEDLRKTEFIWLRKALYAQAFVTFIFWGSPIFVSDRKSVV